jgi:hypothetical protein
LDETKAEVPIYLTLGMKVERKLSDFSTQKWKWNENMKTKTEICGTETEFFWWK